MDLTGVAFNTADVAALGALMAAGLATIWGVRKALSLIGR
jgi:hypothetical protein